MPGPRPTCWPTRFPAPRASCERIGRDPEEIHVSTQALLYLSTDKEWLAGKRSSVVAMPSIVGTPSEVVDIVAAYRQAGGRADRAGTSRWAHRPRGRRPAIC